MKIKIILADDHAIIREGLKPLIEKEPDMLVAGEAENGRETLQQVRALSPDVVIMDISMPDLNGIEATRHIRQEFPGCKVIGLSVHTDNQYVAEMIRAGASGYLPKSCAFKELATAIRTVTQNKTYLSPKVIDSVVAYLQKSTPGGDAADAVLTPREREVLQLLAEGRSTKDISALLCVSERTIEAHRKNIMTKLNLRSVAELTRYAIAKGLTFLE
ncbi:MAG TPA: response regulator transcription factor [bacterium]|nr:response regulator transcription factor [Candidatus Omnitrophota bacterium]HOJ60075.1 response regulator transcription factor [bacterium]HOL94863.1 response regulator transcription factor [bacterium]HPO99723.1 response regulator transcription factor [bacterium]